MVRLALIKLSCLLFASISHTNLFYFLLPEHHQSVSKLLSRIVAPEVPSLTGQLDSKNQKRGKEGESSSVSASSNDDSVKQGVKADMKKLHDHTVSAISFHGFLIFHFFK